MGEAVLGKDSLVAQVEAGGQSEGLLPIHLAAPPLVRRRSQNNHWHRSISTQGLQDSMCALSCLGRAEKINQRILFIDLKSMHHISEIKRKGRLPF